MKKGIVVAAVFAVGAVLASYAPGSAAEIKVGYVDFTRIQSESKAGKDAMKSIETMFKDKQAQLDKRQAELEKLMNEMEKQAPLLSADVRRQKEEKLQKDYKELQRFKSDSEEDLNKKKGEVAAKMFEEVTAVITKFGKEEGYTLILERSVVLYAPEAVDVTEQVIKAYDTSKG